MIESETLLWRGLTDANIELVRQALDARASPDNVNIYGSSALVMACKWGSANIVHLLLDRGADMHAVKGLSDEENLLHVSGFDDKLIQRLLDGGLDPRKLDHNKNSPLSLASKKGCPDAASSLVAAGCPVNIESGQPQDNSTVAPILGAALSLDIAMFDRLMELGADPRAVSLQGRGLLYFAAKASCPDSNEENFKIFIARAEKYGIDINAQDIYGVSAFHFLCQWGPIGRSDSTNGSAMTSRIHAMLDAGASVELKNTKGKTAIDDCAEDRLAAIRAWQARKAISSVLQDAASTGGAPHV